MPSGGKTDLLCTGGVEYAPPVALFIEMNRQGHRIALDGVDKKREQAAATATTLTTTSTTIRADFFLQVLALAVWKKYTSQGQGVALAMAAQDVLGHNT